MLKSAVLSLIFTLAAQVAAADSFWDHNGSLMRIIAQGQERWIVYETPRQGMVDQGVQSGTLFFNGRRIGNSYQGVARAFSRNCPQPMTFPISGQVINESTIVLEGMRPVFSNCQPSGKMKFESLVFTYVSAEPVAKPEIAIPSTGPRRDAGQAYAMASQTLAQVFVYLTPDQLRQSVRSVVYGASGSVCAAPGAWTVSVVIPPVPGYGDIMTGDLAFDDVTGQLTCSTLPMD